jgi:putative phosphoribosyl transferase
LHALFAKGMTMGMQARDADTLVFSDRRQAGTRLAEALGEYRGKGVVVLGIPRGGVPVAAEVARRLDAELDVIVARKLGAPISRELAVGAVTANGGRFLNEQLIRELEVSDAYLERVVAEEMAEAHRRETRFRGGRPLPSLAGRTVIVVDDGLATGATMLAAVRAVRKREPARLVVAVPVGSGQACAAVGQEADEVVCLSQPVPFFAVGAFYEHFEPTEDAEVERILEETHTARRQAATPAA